MQRVVALPHTPTPHQWIAAAYQFCKTQAPLWEQSQRATHAHECFVTAGQLHDLHYHSTTSGLATARSAYTDRPPLLLYGYSNIASSNVPDSTSLPACQVGRKLRCTHWLWGLMLPIQHAHSGLCGGSHSVGRLILVHTSLVVAVVVIACKAGGKTYSICNKPQLSSAQPMQLWVCMLTQDDIELICTLICTRS